MRRAALVLVALASGSLALPAVAGAQPKAVSSNRTVYTTLHSGEYKFDYERRTNFDSSPPRTEVFTVHETFKWRKIVQEVLSPLKKGGVRSVRRTKLEASGGYSEEGTNIHTPITCTYSSDPSKEIRLQGGSGYPAGSKTNPPIRVRWQVINVPPRPTIIGERCKAQYPTWAPTTYAMPGLRPTADYEDAFDGEARTRLKSLPFAQDFDEILSDTESAGERTATGRVEVHAKVYFTHAGLPGDFNKLGNLLANNAKWLLDTTDPGDDADGLLDGLPVDILIPGLPSDGDVNVEVFGHLVPPTPSLRARMSVAAQGDVLIARARSKPKMTDIPSLHLVPTAKGKEFMQAPRPARKLTVKITFDPSGKRKAVSGSNSAEVPARL